MASGLNNRAYKEVFEDWLDATEIGTSATTAGVEWLNSADASDTAFVATDTAAGPVAQAATTTTDDHMCEISHRALAWSPQNGEMVMRTRVQVSTGGVSDVAFTVGFSDDQLEDSNTLPVELATTTFTSNASTFVGVVYDSDATNKTLHAFYVDGDADASQSESALNLKVAPVAAKWLGVEIRVTNNGSAKAVAEITVVDESTGVSGYVHLPLTVTSTTLLVPHIAFENRAATAHTFEIDSVYARMSRSTT